MQAGQRQPSAFSVFKEELMDEDLIYEILSVVEEIPEGKVATYGLSFHVDQMARMKEIKEYFGM